MRSLRVMLLVAVVMIIGVGIIHADDENVPTFSDGRVNNWQMDEPVAVYCVFDHTEDVNVGVFQRIEAWGLDGVKILEASAAQISAAPAGTALASNWSYTLTKLTGSSFEISAPNGYTFTWQRGDTGC
ncbi:MAG: hypothetical protein IT319_01655 [Anaerolineae bacterium]|nr:hypothetical protein [Anaerolineae bacterium]